MRRLIIGLVTLAVTACSNDTGPNTPPPVPASQLHFVIQDSVAAPPLYADTASFWAKVGDGRELHLYYQDGSGSPGEEFLRFEVPGDGLLRKPDGTGFNAGDSILISVRVVDRKKFVFDFQPTGLQFSPDHPARLKLGYDRSDHDYDGDGQITAADTAIQSRLDLWRNEPPDTLWFKLNAVNFESYEELDVNIYHFTVHAVAW